MYTDTQGEMLELAVKGLIASVREFVQHWVGEKGISGEGREMTQLLKAPSTSERYLRVSRTRLAEYIFDDI